MKPAKYKTGQHVKTPHGEGEIIGVSVFRADPSSDPTEHMYGVRMAEKHPKDEFERELPFLESELDNHNASSA